MLTSLVQEVKEIYKNGKNMYLVTVEGQNYMCFGSKWKNLKNNVIKYEKETNSKGYTNLELKEIIGKKEQEDELFTKEDKETARKDIQKETSDLSDITVLKIAGDAASAFIPTALVNSPDEWLETTKMFYKNLKSFLEQTEDSENI
jgi:hypothetical protein